MSLFNDANSIQPTKGARLRGGGSWFVKKKQSHERKEDFFTSKKCCHLHYLDVLWDAPDKEHQISGVDVKQRVSAWSFAFLDELLLISETLAWDGKEDFSMPAQPASKEVQVTKWT